ncbi:Xaa-Pro peptidase family protein [Desulfovibrio sp. OttesenSCG-928-A18]|nr:Xaa-Pro peptidase family protein [Desulfovibrio sp. OttesenSCG-928-A18]
MTIDADNTAGIRLSDRIVPEAELLARHERCRSLMAALHPEAGGLMVFSRVGMYYFTGTLANGVFWLPARGEALLMLRKGLERARLESPYIRTAVYRSYSELGRVAAGAGSPLTPVISAEQSGLPWNMAENLRQRLPDSTFQDAMNLMNQLRALKSPWEMERMRTAGAGMARSTEDILPGRLHPGMTEMEVARIVSDVFFSQGSCGLTRMNAAGEEMFLGYTSSGQGGNYPTYYNGPLGSFGMHPAAPYLGSPHKVWEKGEFLLVDTGFCFEGYNTDKTISYFAGKEKDIPTRAAKGHELCRRIELDIARELRPGAIPAELYAKALAMADQGGFGKEFMGLGENKVPFLGHGIGLCIDEWPVIAARFTRPLEAGMTIALEPKVGLPGIGMVGTENTWEITEDGGVCQSGTVCGIVCVE